MGLDMYLDAEVRFYNCKWDKGENEEKRINKEIRKIIPEMQAIDTGNLNYVTVSCEIGYWRKANAIHQWFVDNCQDGNDNCQKHCVTQEQLKELLEICKKIKKTVRLKEGKINNGGSIKDGKKVPILVDGKTIENPEVAEEMLPTTDGFFFGSMDYNEYYMHDIDNTIEIIERCLKLSDKWMFSYHSSW